MLLKSNKGFTLIEVLISTGLVAASIIFIFGAFTASLTSAQLSEDITLACYAAEEKIWEVIQTQKTRLSSSGGEIITPKKKFTWSYTISKTDDPALKKLDFAISWPRMRQGEQRMEFSTLLLANEK